MRSITQTYGISEVMHVGDGADGAYYHEAWWWCRYHRRPELGSWTMIDCIRVGPFMAEDEAKNVGTALGESRG